VRFYAKVRPFGVWGPVRREAVRRGLVPAKDPMPTMDVVNAVIASFFQLCLGSSPIHVPEGLDQHVPLLALCVCTLVVLFFTWYKYLPSPEER